MGKGAPGQRAQVGTGIQAEQAPSRTVLFGPQLLGQEIATDSRQPAQLSDTELANEIKQLEQIEGKIMPAAALVYQELIRAHEVYSVTLRNLRREKDARDAKTQNKADVYTLEEVVALTEIPDGLPLSQLTFIDEKTGRSLKGEVRANVAFPSMYTWLGSKTYPNLTLGGLRDFINTFKTQTVAPLDVSVNARFTSSGRRVASERVVIPRTDLARAVATYIQAQTPTAPQP